MFDTYVAGRNTTTYVPYEKTVKEIRAPTDDSIRIFEEIRQKAYESILDTIVINDNIFNCKAEIYKEAASFSTICYYKFTLNNRKFSGSITDNNLMGKIEWIQKIYEEAAKQISEQLINVIAKST